jgi:hypothetical protein
MRLVIKNAERIILIAIISFLFIVAEGSSFTFAKPEPVSKIPFQDVTTARTKTSTAQLSFIKEAREVSTTYEHHIVSTALQLMRVTERVKAVPAVTAATNDMGSFPSPKHSLYPNYLSKRFSQFKYTVNDKGIVNVDTVVTTTDTQLERIEKWLERLE